MIGFGVCGFGALFQIRQDVLHSNAEIKESVSASLSAGPLWSVLKLLFPTSLQADKYRIGLDARVAALEAVISGSSKANSS